MAQIRAIQCLRGVAALMVVFAHAQSDTAFQAARIGAGFARDATLPWVAGVDLFFITSGFIMVHASRDLFAAPFGARLFLTRRLIRIAPLYWMITAISLVILAIAAALGKAAFPAPGEILGSFAFLPYENAHNEMRPIAGQGWTLNYEMFFYALFALFLRFRRAVAIAGVSLTLALVVALGAWFSPPLPALAFWSDPIVLEFALGMGVAWAWRRGLRINVGAAALIVAIALGWLALDLDLIRSTPLDAAEPNGFARVFGCGAPMALLFAAAVCVAPPIAATNRVGVAAVEIGDASYALYLFHPLAIIAARKLYLAAHIEAVAGLWPLVAADIAIALALALAIHHWVEDPITRALQRAVSPRRQAPMARETRASTREAA